MNCVNNDIFNSAIGLKWVLEAEVEELRLDGLYCSLSSAVKVYSRQALKYELSLSLTRPH